jgi:hypothetical protein
VTAEPPSLSTDSTATAVTDGSPSTADAASPQQRVVAIANERPEAAAGAAFAGGLLLALILKRLAR